MRFFFSNCFAPPCLQETSRSGFPWWSKWSQRVPGSAQPPGTTADRMKTPACLPTPGTTSEVSLWCHHPALASLLATVRHHLFRLHTVGDTWWMSQMQEKSLEISLKLCPAGFTSNNRLKNFCTGTVFIAACVAGDQLVHIGWLHAWPNSRMWTDLCVHLLICYFYFDSSAFSMCTVEITFHVFTEKLNVHCS